MAKEIVPKGSIIVGRVLSPHGMTGAFRVEAISDSPGRFYAGGILYLEGQPHEIHLSTRRSDGSLVLKLEGIDNRDDAYLVRNALLTVTEEMVPSLPLGEYYYYQIIGMDVYTQAGDSLGRITEVIRTGSNDVYVVMGESGEILIPALDEVIREVDVEKGTMTVSLPEGLR